MTLLGSPELLASPWHSQLCVLIGSPGLLHGKGTEGSRANACQRAVSVYPCITMVEVGPGY